MQTTGRYLQTIAEATIAEPSWSRSHWQTIRSAYARAPYFDDYAAPFADLYAHPVSDRLSAVNHSFIVALCRALGVTTPITWS